MVIRSAGCAATAIPTNLALWFATLIYLFVVEIPLYFPNIFGVEDKLGVVFAHNAFTVQFLFERLPLYIVALYPAVITLAYEIVRSLNVFRDRGIVVGAVCVGFVHHCFYEVFDQLGPQLRWWAWNTDNPLNHPMLASVPLTSVFIFAALGPIVVTILVMLLVGRNVNTGTQFSRLSLTWRTHRRRGPGALRCRRPQSSFVTFRRRTSQHHRAGDRDVDRARPHCGHRATGPGPAVVTRPEQRCRDVAQRVRPRVRPGLSDSPRDPLGERLFPRTSRQQTASLRDGTPIGNVAYATVCFVVATLAVFSVSTTHDLESRPIPITLRR